MELQKVVLMAVCSDETLAVWTAALMAVVRVLMTAGTLAGGMVFALVAQ